MQSCKYLGLCSVSVQLTDQPCTSFHTQRRVFPAVFTGKSGQLVRNTQRTVHSMATLLLAPSPPLLLALPAPQLVAAAASRTGALITS